MAVLFRHRPDLVHIYVMLYKSQWHLEPAAHSCFSHFQSHSSVLCAPPGFAIILICAKLAKGKKKVFKASIHWPQKKNLTSVLANVLLKVLWLFNAVLVFSTASQFQGQRVYRSVKTSWGIWVGRKSESIWGHCSALCSIYSPEKASVNGIFTQVPWV